MASAHATVLSMAWTLPHRAVLFYESLPEEPAALGEFEALTQPALEHQIFLARVRSCAGGGALAGQRGGRLPRPRSHGAHGQGVRPGWVREKGPSPRVGSLHASQTT